LDVSNSTLDNKEGFINIKPKDSGYFKKRYFKLVGGNLVYFKIKKGTTDIVDFTKQNIISNLLLSNVKKNDKEYDYPFCFEVVSAANKKAFLFQANTEREATEWFFVIRNAIFSSISGYNNSSTGNESSNSNMQNVNRNFDFIENKSRTNHEQLLDKIITSNKCVDCAADRPVWYSFI